MIQLRSDCLVFETSNGETIPCSAEEVTIELIGSAAELLDKEMIRHAAAAVLHYFRNELQRTTVTVAEFTEALEKVLRNFGFAVGTAEHLPKPSGEPIDPAESKSAASDVIVADLRLLACESGKGFELFFFPRLKQEIASRLKETPRALRFRGLRGCVKQLIGARRWTGRCQQLNDQIVEYLRECFTRHEGGATCAMLVD